MPLEDLGNIGEAIGGIAVLMTLIYLAFQMRQNTRLLQQNSDLLRATTEAAISRDASEARWRVASSREMMELWLSGLAGRELDDVDQARFEQLVATLVHALRFELRTEGVIANESGSFWKATFSAPGVSRWWKRTKHIYPPDFVANVDAMIDN